MNINFISIASLSRMFRLVSLKRVLFAFLTGLMCVSAGYAQRASSAQKEGFKKIAILSFINIEKKPGIDYLEPSISSQIRTRLSEGYAFTSLPEKQYEKTAAEKGISHDQIATFNAALAVGEAAGQDMVVTGSYWTRSAGDSTAVSLRISVIDVRQKRLVGEFVSDSPVDNRMWVMVDQASVRIAEMMKLYDSRPNLTGKSFYDGNMLYVNGGVRFRLKSYDDIALDRVMYKIDNGEEKMYVGEFSAASEGKHSFNYYGIDKAGNSETSKSFSFTTDISAPETKVYSSLPVIALNGKNYISAKHVFSIVSGDSLSGVGSISYSLNGRDYQEFTAGFTPAKNGEIILRIISGDNVGNSTPLFSVVSENGTVIKTDQYVLTPDLTAPEVSIGYSGHVQQKAGKITASRESLFSVNATDAGSGIKSVFVRVDGKGDFFPYEKPVFFTESGFHFVEAKASDNAGNVSSTVVLPVYADIIPPKSDIRMVSE